MKTTSSSEKLIALELNLLRLIFSKHETFDKVSLYRKWIWYVNWKNKDEIEWNKKDSNMTINADEVVRSTSDSDSDKEILNEEVLDEMYENDESIEETLDCKCSEILKMILKKVCRKLFTVVDMMNEMKCINTLKIFVKTDLEETSLMHVCHKHLLRLADHFNLQVKMLNSAELRNWLCQCWKHRSDLIAFKTSFQSTLWWCLKSRSWIESDDHDVYAKCFIKSSFLKSSEFDWAKAIINEIAESSTWDNWVETENLIVKNVFSWLWNEMMIEEFYEFKIENLIEEEFDLYLYHQCERNEQSNKDWLQTMYFFLTQQIIRQNLQYWALYICLQSHWKIHLVFYLYYAKYAQIDDATYFRHIDMNILKYIESDHEANIIQDSVSLDDENIHECTKLVSDFHNYIIDWWANVCFRERVMNDHIHDLEKLWISDDILIYDDFVSVSCWRDNVQVIRSEISHESTSDYDETVWKIVLSWFVRMCEDEETLNNEESDK